MKWAGLMWLAVSINTPLCPKELTIIFSSLVTHIAQELITSVAGHCLRGCSLSLLRNFCHSASLLQNQEPTSTTDLTKPDRFHTEGTGATFSFPLPCLWGSPSPHMAVGKPSVCLMSETHLFFRHCAQWSAEPLLSCPSATQGCSQGRFSIWGLGGGIVGFTEFLYSISLPVPKGSQRICLDRSISGPKHPSEASGWGDSGQIIT